MTAIIHHGREFCAKQVPCVPAPKIGRKDSIPVSRTFIVDFVLLPDSSYRVGFTSNHRSPLTTVPRGGTSRDSRWTKRS
jgi:hypothetical protein